MKKLQTSMLALLLTAGVFAQNSDYKDNVTANLVSITNEQAEPSATALQSTLYELIDQSHAVHQAHWNLRGPQFISIHELLDSFYGQLSVYIDDVAERKLAIGFPVQTEDPYKQVKMQI
ncbi:Dps family protein [Leeuwenhoekiella sp. NPDC079379]|uniref:Dps family protein n=1 Tax=Leeuwenhoekiella sp. NPDC079379 TaxID=3364122 RepID=UPI0037CC89BA